MEKQTTAVRSPRFAGVLAMGPVVAALAPFGFAIGATVAERGVPGAAGWSTSALIFGGSAQMAAIELIDVGAGLMVVVGTVLVVSARLALPAAALGTHWRDAPPRWRAMAAAFIVEPLYVVVAKRYEDEGTAAEKRKFYEGAAAVLWLGWVTSTAVGILVGGHVPEAFALDAMMPLSLIGLLLPMLRDRRSVVAAAVGTVAACVLAAAPNGSGVVLASVLGVVGASVWRDRR